MIINHYEISAQTTIIITGLLAAFTLVKGWDQRITRIYGFYTLLICSWCFGWYKMIAAKSALESLLWARVLHFPAALIPPGFLHFVQCLLGQEDARQKRLRIILYFCGAGFVGLLFNNSFVASVSEKPGFSFYIDPGPLYALYYAYFILVVIYALAKLYRALLTATGEKRRQISYVFTAYLIGYSGGTLVFITNYGIPLPWFALYTIPIAHILLFYAIIQHKLLDLKLFIRRAGLLTTIYASLLTLLFPLVFAIHKGITASKDDLPILLSVEVIIVSLVLSVGPFLYAYFIRRSSYFREQTMAGLTHELKSPLAAIESALAYLSQQKNSAPDDIKRQEYLEMIERNSSRLRQFAENLLNTFELPEKCGLISPEPTDVNTLCDHALETFLPMATTKKIDLCFQKNTAPLIVACDKTKVEQILSNLIANAIKFTDSGEIILRSEKMDGHVSISVCDTGEGVLKTDLPHVFDRFYQGKAGRGKKGSGIGLTIAKTWVEAHGGKIWAESEGEGKGTKVVFTLPI